MKYLFLFVFLSIFHKTIGTPATPDLTTDQTMESYLTQIKSEWDVKPTAKGKRHAFRYIMRFLKGSIAQIGRKAKTNKDNVELKSTYKAKLGSRTDIDIAFPKNDGSCDINLDDQSDSFDISLTEVGDTGVVCRGTTLVTKLELVSVICCT